MMPNTKSRPVACADRYGITVGTSHCEPIRIGKAKKGTDQKMKKMKMVATGVCAAALGMTQMLPVNGAEPVPAFIFGQNLEHTRAAVQGGLSAEIVRNRKFAGKPSVKGVALMWEAYGDQAEYYAGCSARTNGAAK